MSKGALYAKLIVSGMLSGILYLLLYLFEKEILAAFTRSDGLYPALPVLAALVFSFVHGAFAGHVWDALGVTARPRIGLGFFLRRFRGLTFGRAALGTTLRLWLGSGFRTATFRRRSR